MTHILETNDDLDNCGDCDFFDFSGETHLAKITKCYDGDTFHCIFKHNGLYQKFHISIHPFLYKILYI